MVSFVQRSPLRALFHQLQRYGVPCCCNLDLCQSLNVSVLSVVENFARCTVRLDFSELLADVLDTISDLLHIGVQCTSQVLQHYQDFPDRLTLMGLIPNPDCSWEEVSPYFFRQFTDALCPLGSCQYLRELRQALLLSWHIMCLKRLQHLIDSRKWDTGATSQFDRRTLKDSFPSCLLNDSKCLVKLRQALLGKRSKLRCT
ncbi:hypothetical protein M513_03457 [Trichuris suis]|uniref:Uncharacterized protein n=1 Tax=Trichuris suis TaxID=68888 RepID=A0A085MER3_9BILA|nr:hypothetical protein M513_03457 [Trichuris suis]